jgi:hypothetical protein
MKDVTQRFGTNAHRLYLVSGLQAGIAALAVAGCTTLYLDGSFVTAKDLPGDYDACWEVAGVSVAALDPVLIDFDNGRAAQKAKYYGEYFPAHSPAAFAPLRTFLEFFQIDKDTGHPKGIIKISPL